MRLVLASLLVSTIARADGRGSMPDPSVRDAVCPPGERQNDHVVDLDGNALLHTFPSDAFGYRIGWQAARTAAGSVVVNVQYRRGRDCCIDIRIDDMIHHCTGAPGTASVLLATEEIRDRKARRRPGDLLQSTPGGIVQRPLVILEWGQPTTDTTVVTWIGDRCRITVDGPMQAGALSVMLEELDLEALDRLCAAR